VKEVPYNNDALFNVWSEGGIETPDQLRSLIGLTDHDRDKLSRNVLVSTELIANTLAFIDIPYDEGSNKFLDPWMKALRESEKRLKMSESTKGQPSPMKGRRHSPETKSKMSKSQSGRVHSPETKAKISAGLRGKTLTPETKAKISETKKRIIFRK